MLKFLDNRTHEKSKKSPIKFKPEMAYGISIEAPEEFQTSYTILHNQTYANPYLQFQKKRENKMTEENAAKIQPRWTKKTNLIHVEQQKILSSQPEVSPQGRFRESYKQGLDESQTRFHMAKGQFTNFIQKNHRYRSIGPIHGKERTDARIQQTKKSVWMKSDMQSPNSNSKILYSTYYDQFRKNQSVQSILLKSESGISHNSKYISEKGRIRYNRQKLNITFQENLEQRKHSLLFTKTDLPKLNSEILTKYQPFKLKAKQQVTFEDEIKDIDEFEHRLRKQFR